MTQFIVVLVSAAGCVIFGIGTLDALAEGDLENVLVGGVIAAGCFLLFKESIKPPVYKHKGGIQMYERQKRWWE